ncbi:hypothetical protein PHLCEN_2v10657 [Hermanssonia centrifuga]|uniref:Uncharacterized protein n=1 Tax=Hermanssonia centrifuga TaxID=98765 RepID=A0A2R6NM85_9APHY|nr:hypothetical protein PHLCEN_2v10657 [Hermanssonia centrifuga]
MSTTAVNINTSKAEQLVLDASQLMIKTDADDRGTMAALMQEIDGISAETQWVRPTLVRFYSLQPIANLFQIILRLSNVYWECDGSLASQDRILTLQHGIPIQS